MSRWHAYCCEPQSCHNEQNANNEAYCGFRFLKRSSSRATTRSCSTMSSASAVLARPTAVRSSSSVFSATASLLLRRRTLCSWCNSSDWVLEKYTSRTYESLLCPRRRDVATFTYAQEYTQVMHTLCCVNRTCKLAKAGTETIITQHAWDYF